MAATLQLEHEEPKAVPILLLSKSRGRAQLFRAYSSSKASPYAELGVVFWWTLAWCIRAGTLKLHPSPETSLRTPPSPARTPLDTPSILSLCNAIDQTILLTGPSVVSIVPVMRTTTTFSVTSLVQPRSIPSAADLQPPQLLVTGPLVSLLGYLSHQLPPQQTFSPRIAAL